MWYAFSAPDDVIEAALIMRGRVGAFSSIHANTSVLERLMHAPQHEHVHVHVHGSLEYVEDNTVQLKGRVACEINTCDELIASEIVFENVLERLEPPEIAGAPIHNTRDE